MAKNSEFKNLSENLEKRLDDLNIPKETLDSVKSEIDSLERYHTQKLKEERKKERKRKRLGVKGAAIKYAPEAVTTAGCAVALGFLGNYLFGDNGGYLKLLRKLDKVVDGGLDIFNMGERAERDQAIVKSTIEAVMNAKVNDRSLEEISNMSPAQAKKYIANLPTQYQARMQARIKSLKVLHQQHAEMTPRLEQKIELYEQNTQDIKFKIKRFEDELESLIVDGHDELEALLNKSKAVRTGMGVMKKFKEMLTGQKVEDAQAARKEYLKAAEKVYDSLDQVKRVLEGLSKKYGIDESNLKGVIDAYKKDVEAEMQKQESYLIEMKTEFEESATIQRDYGVKIKQLKKVEAQLETTLSTGRKLEEGFDRANSTYDTGRELQSTKRTAREGNPAFTKRVMEEVKKNDRYFQENRMYAASPNKIFGYEDPGYISAGIFGGAIVASLALVLAVSKAKDMVSGGLMGYVSRTLLRR